MPFDYIIPELEWPEFNSADSGLEAEFLRSPARISRRMWHVGTRAKKLLFELTDFLHTRTKKNPSTSVRVQERGAQRSVDLSFLETESVTNSSRSFMRLNSAHFGRSGI